MPAQLAAAGSSARSSRSTRTFTQSSSRPTISVHTGANAARVAAGVLEPAQAPLHRLTDRERLATVNPTVELIATPRAVASSIATMPAAVVGNFTWMFGASRWKRSPWASIASALPYSAGFVWRLRRPLRPACASNTGRRSRPPRTPISSDRSPR